MGQIDRSVLLLVLTTVSVFGQAASINGEASGVITDPTGAPVPNVAVSIRNGETGYTQSSVTSGSGQYRFPVLPLGTYEIEVKAQGFSPLKQTGIRINAGISAVIDITLQVGAVAAEIVVSGAAPIIDPARTDQGSTLGANAVRNSPLVSRNPYNFILQQPNVSGRGNTEFGVPRKVNANGFNGRINYQLDGSNNVQSDRAGIRLLPISQTWVEEVQFVNNGFAPEFGNTVGTVFNTITRSGTNDLHGDGAYIFRRTPMSSRIALLPPERPNPEVNVDSGYVNAGGRIVKDKVFFFGGWERVKRDLPNAVTVSPATVAQLGLPAEFANAIPFSQNVTFFIAKADWQIAQSHRLSLRYSGHRNDSPYNSGGGLNLVDRTYNFVDRSHGGQAQLISVLRPNLVNELRAQVPYRSQQNQRFEGTGTGPVITISGVASFGNSPDAGFVYEEMTPEVTENLTWSTGAHSLKFGGNLRSIRDTQVAATSATYTFPSVAAYLAARNGSMPLGYQTFAQTIGEPSIEYNSLFTSLYAQDSYKPISNVTLTYGLRYDVYRPPDAIEDSPFEYSREFRTDKNNLAPRVGLAVAWGKTVLRASGGIFYDPFQTDQYRRALLNNGAPTFFSASLTPMSAGAPSFPGVLTQANPPASRDITTVDPNFSTLYSSNANVSLTRQLASDLAIIATYLYTRGNRLPVFRNINLVPSGRVLADGRPIFGTGRVFPAFNNLTVAESVGQSVYNGLTLRVDKRLSRGFELFGSYTWSHAIDDAPEQNNIDSANFLLSDPTNRRRDRGNSLSDRRHVFNGNLLFTPQVRTDGKLVRYLVNNNRLALLVNLQSGEVFNIGSNRNLNGDASTANTFQRPLFIGRNTVRSPRLSEFNARYSRLIPIRERWRAEFFAESTNLFNRTNVTGVNSTATVDAAGAILGYPSLAWTAAQDQRLIQLGFKLNF